MRVAEIFHSIQGEGRLAGVPSVFIRTSGCNLRCVWCDTPYTSWEPEGEEKSLDDIIVEAKSYPTRHAVLTGGEPLIAPEIEALSERLKAENFHITIETAATVFKPVRCDLMSLSPKLANSTPWERGRGRARGGAQRRALPPSPPPPRSCLFARAEPEGGNCRRGGGGRRPLGGGARAGASPPPSTASNS